MKIFMGAPNLVRGASTNGNLKASETIERGVCSGLISDYYPECMLQAAFMAEERLELTLPEALGLVTSGPGAFIDQDGLCGTLREGARADFIVGEQDIALGPGGTDLGRRTVRVSLPGKTKESLHAPGHGRGCPENRLPCHGLITKYR